MKTELMEKDILEATAANDRNLNDIARLLDWFGLELEKKVGRKVNWLEEGQTAYVRARLIEALGCFSGKEDKLIREALEEI